MFNKEKVFKAEKNVKYVFKKSYKDTSNLIIVFSAFSAEGEPPKYNYGGTINEFDCNKLYILDDFGSRASYYLCKNREFTIEKSVYSLIESIIKEYNIKSVMACGSSKGGYAALYYGIKYNFDHIVVASPQYKLGDYLMEQANAVDVADFMAGIRNEDNKYYLNNIMHQVISRTNNKPNIFIHLGEGEAHYSDHVKPLLAHLDANNINYELDLGPYDKHNDVVLYFPSILKKKIREIFHFPKLILKSTNDNLLINSTFEFEVETDSDNNRIAWFLFKDGKKIESKNYEVNNKFYKVKFDDVGEYFVQAFVMNDKKLKASTQSKKINITT